MAHKLIVMTVLIGLWAATLVFGARGVDKSLLLAVYAADAPSLALAAIWLTKLGDWSTLVVVTLLGAAWLAARRGPWHASTLLAVSFSGRGLVILQKAYFARLRPEEQMRLVEVNYQSFPSGHSANSMIVYVTLAWLLFDDAKQRHRALLAGGLLSLLIGVSRPMLGVHWPSDVLGGWAFGLAWTTGCLLLAQTLKRNSRTSPS